jgi:translation initiation factor eIF-2B subunit alpha
MVFLSQRLSDFKEKLVRQGNQYIAEAASYSEKIADFADGFVKDGSVVWPSSVNWRRLSFSHINVTLRQILTHSHSRVVMKALLHAHKRKRISVYVTEGVK